MCQLRGNHTCVNLQKVQQLKSRHQLTWAGMGMGHLVQKPPFQRPLTFSWRSAWLFLPDACLAHSQRLAKQFHLTAEARLFFSLTPGWPRPRGCWEVASTLSSIPTAPRSSEALQEEHFSVSQPW